MFLHHCSLSKWRSSASVGIFLQQQNSLPAPSVNVVIASKQEGMNNEGFQQPTYGYLGNKKSRKENRIFIN